jgi:hypothetical protein
VGIVKVAILILTIAAYLAATVSLTQLHSSDAAGNGLAQVYAVVFDVALWILLGVLLMVTASSANLPHGIYAFALFPSAAVANFVAIALLSDDFYHSRWPIVIPAIAPVLLILLIVSAHAPWLRVHSHYFWAGLLLLSIAPWPEFVYRSRNRSADRAGAAAEWKAGEPQRIEDERRKTRETFAKLTQDSPLREWLEFTGPGHELRNEAFSKIRQMPRRQADAELMFRQGFDYITRDLPELDLEPTPAVCEGARKCLRGLIKDMTPADGRAIYLQEDSRINEYRRGIEWMAKNGCDCRTELEALDRVLDLYVETSKREEFRAFVRGLR